MYAARAAAYFKHATRISSTADPVTFTRRHIITASSVQASPLHKHELKEVLRLSTDLDWSTSENIIKSCFKEDPYSYMVARSNDSKIVGCLCQYVMDKDLWFAGLHITKGSLRGRGIGTLLWNKALGRFPEINGGANFWPDRTTFAAEHGIPVISFEMHHLRGIKKVFKDEVGKGDSIFPYHTRMEGEVASYDAALNTVDRRQFLSHWMNPSVTKSFVARDNSVITGYGCVQPIWCGEYHIGPLLANTPDIAFGIFHQMLNAIPDGAVINLLTPSIQIQRMSFVEDCGLSYVTKLNRQYTKKDIMLPLDKAFAITSVDAGLL